MLKIIARSLCTLTVEIPPDARTNSATYKALDMIAQYLCDRAEIKLVNSNTGLGIFMFNQYRDIKDAILDRADVHYRNTIANAMKF